MGRDGSEEGRGRRDERRSISSLSSSLIPARSATSSAWRAPTRSSRPTTWPEWWEAGLRVDRPRRTTASARYAHGTTSEGGLTDLGARPLLEAMEQLGMILDVTHLSDESFWEALDAFGGRVLASHQNCRALVPDAAAVHRRADQAP